MERSLRIVTGLVLYLFVTTHLINVSMGVISPELIEATRPVFMSVWSNRPVGMFLFACLVIHTVLGFRTLYFRNTLNMTPSDAVQFASGFLVAPLLIPHIWGIIAMNNILGTPPTYPILMQFFWIDSPLEGLRQVLLIVTVWIHGSIGIFTWLRLKSWWRGVAPLVYPLIVLIPVLGMLGFVEGGKLAMQNYAETQYSQNSGYLSSNNQSETLLSDAEQTAANAAAEKFATDYAFVIKVKWYAIWIYMLVLLSVLLARYFRLAGKSGELTVTYDNGTVVRAKVGRTLLELSHLNNIPHAHLCRGRGRCGTCRVRILESTAPLPEPSELESSALAHTHSDDNVRLACQCVPGAGALKIERLLQPDITHDELREQKNRRASEPASNSSGASPELASNPAGAPLSGGAV